MFQDPIFFQTKFVTPHLRHASRGEAETHISNYQEHYILCTNKLIVHKTYIST